MKIIYLIISIIMIIYSIYAIHLRKVDDKQKNEGVILQFPKSLAYLPLFGIILFSFTVFIPTEFKIEEIISYPLFLAFQIFSLYALLFILRWRLIYNNDYFKIRTTFKKEEKLLYSDIINVDYLLSTIKIKTKNNTFKIDKKLDYNNFLENIKIHQLNNEMKKKYKTKIGNMLKDCPGGLRIFLFTVISFLLLILFLLFLVIILIKYDFSFYALLCGIFDIMLLIIFVLSVYSIYNFKKHPKLFSLMWGKQVVKNIK